MPCLSDVLLLRLCSRPSDFFFQNRESVEMLEFRIFRLLILLVKYVGQTRIRTLGTFPEKVQRQRKSQVPAKPPDVYLRDESKDRGRFLF